MHISNTNPAVGTSSAASGSKPVSSGHGSAVSGFADTLHETGGSSPPELSEADEIARMQREREAYNEAREREIQGRSSNPPAYQIALPVNANGYMPFLTLDQQKLMDRITDSYLGRPAQEMDKLWDELRQNNLHPEQLVQTARYFINLEGEVVSRKVATAGLRPAPAPSLAPIKAASTVWNASAV